MRRKEGEKEKREEDRRAGDGEQSTRNERGGDREASKGIEGRTGVNEKQ